LFSRDFFLEIVGCTASTTRSGGGSARRQEWDREGCGCECGRRWERLESGVQGRLQWEERQSVDERVLKRVRVRRSRAVEGNKVVTSWSRDRRSGSPAQGGASDRPAQSQLLSHPDKASETCHPDLISPSFLSFCAYFPLCFLFCSPLVDNNHIHCPALYPVSPPLLHTNKKHSRRDSRHAMRLPVAVWDLRLVNASFLIPAPPSKSRAHPSHYRVQTRQVS
jgi:hypothetical protein